MEMHNIIYTTILISQWASGFWISNTLIIAVRGCICISVFHFVPFCNHCRLHRLLVDDGTHGKKPSFQRLITASRSGTPMNMEHGHQVCWWSNTTYLHHTVQAAMSVYIYLCKSVNVLLVIETNTTKQPKVQGSICANICPESIIGNGNKLVQAIPLEIACSYITYIVPTFRRRMDISII